MYRAVQAVQVPGYNWSDVHAFQRPLSMLDALPILAFGFQASTGNPAVALATHIWELWQCQPRRHTPDCVPLSGFNLHDPIIFRLSPHVQCHTNLVAVFAELEEEPDLFGSSSSLTSLAAAAATDNNPNNPSTGAGATPPDGSSASLTGKAAASGGQAPGGGGATAAPAAAEVQPEQRVMLLRNPPRRFVRAVQRTPKLLGMVQVVSAASESGLAGQALLQLVCCWAGRLSATACSAAGPMRWQQMGAMCQQPRLPGVLCCPCSRADGGLLLLRGPVWLPELSHRCPLQHPA
jgi:hypothetical protein